MKRIMRRKYLFILIVSVGVFVFSAKGIYHKIERYLYTPKPHLSPLSPKQNPSASKQEKDKGAENLKEREVHLANENIEKESTKEIQPSTEVVPTSKYFKVVLRYENKKAKRVKLTGSFYGWKEREMKRKAPGVWEEELWLRDKGSYRYYFIVDGKKILDPKAKKTPDGEYSLLEVR